MIFKRTLIYIVLLILLVFGYFHIQEKKDISLDKKKAFLFIPKNINIITIDLEGKSKIKLKRSGNFWDIKENGIYRKADKIIVNNILNQFHKLPELENFIPAHKMSVYGLDSPKITVNLKSSEKEFNYFFGDSTPRGNRFYLSVKGGKEVFLVDNFVKKYLRPDPFYYREKGLLYDYDKDEISYFKISSEKMDFEFIKKKNGWFYNDIKLDEARINELIIKLYLLRAKKYFEVTDDNMEKFGFDPVKLNIKIGRDSKDLVNLKVGYNQEKGSYVERISAEGEKMLCLTNDMAITNVFSPDIRFYKNRTLIKLMPKTIKKVEFILGKKSAVYGLKNEGKTVFPIKPVPEKTEKYYTDIVLDIMDKLALLQVEDFYTGNSESKEIQKLEKSPSTILRVTKKDGSNIEFKILAIKSGVKKEFLTQISGVSDLVYINWDFYRNIVKIWD